MYIDASIKHKSPMGIEMNLIIFSGINNEGKNVLFAFGMLKEVDKESFQWIL